MNKITATIGLILASLAIGTATVSAATSTPEHTKVALRSSWG